MTSDEIRMSRLEKFGKVGEINELLKKDVNIVSFLTDNHKKETSTEDEMISYDLRAGLDLKNFHENPRLYKCISEKILSYIDEIGVKGGRIVECGAGEGIVLSEICKNPNCCFSWARGLDISWSRTAYAQTNLINYDNSSIDIDFFVGDFFCLPFKDDSIDVIYTMQGIYGMGGHEETLLRELYRCSRKYLILIEPCYELAGEKARERMNRLGYVKNLKGIAESLKFKVIKHELFGLDSNPLNPAAVLIIEKDDNNNFIDDAVCCPYSHGDLTRIGNALYCEKSKLSYPILNGVACLTKENAIVSSKLKDICKKN